MSAPRHRQRFVVESADGIQLKTQLWHPNPAATAQWRLPPPNSSAGSSGSGRRPSDTNAHASASLVHDYSNTPVVVFVHQWSKLGGCGQLMHGMAKMVCEEGLPAVTFDLRGVNGSSGSSTWTGVSEVADVVAVCEWCVQQLAATHIVLVGSSAGAPIAGSAVDRVSEVCAYVGIGYVFGWWASWVFSKHYDNILLSSKPKLFVTGTKDGFCPIKTFDKVFEGCQGPKEKHVVEGVGHFELESPTYDPMVVQLLLNFTKRHVLGAHTNTHTHNPAVQPRPRTPSNGSDSPTSSELQELAVRDVPVSVQTLTVASASGLFGQAMTPDGSPAARLETTQH